MNIQDELPPLRSLLSGRDQTMRDALVSELMSSNFPSNALQLRRRRLLVPAFAGITSVLILVAAVMVGTSTTGDRAPIRIKTPEPISSQGLSAASAITNDCARSYDLTTLKERAFAFDGTVSRITAMQPPADGTGVLLGYVYVTFHVNEWFRGGKQSSVALDMIKPLASPDRQISYGVGTRLLVSGEPRFGGSPLHAAVAWGCGFTRSYNKSTAASWRQVFRRSSP